MIDSYNIEYIQLHVRKSNRAAFTLYRDKLGFQIHRKEVGYCELSTWIFRLLSLTIQSDGDGEDAYSMRIVLKPRSLCVSYFCTIKLTNTTQLSSTWSQIPKICTCSTTGSRELDFEMRKTSESDKMKISNLPVSHPRNFLVLYLELPIWRTRYRVCISTYNFDKYDIEFLDGYS